MQKINTFKGTSKFSTWLFSVTQNYCTDQVRKGKGKHLESLEHYVDLTDESEFNKNECHEEAKKIDRFYQILEEISPEDYQLLLMKYQFKKSIVELQHIYQLSASAVKMRLMRAKSKAIKMYGFQVATA
jgi:RNA polymerase sigma-70 factor (ECF subfamily)